MCRIENDRHVSQTYGVDRLTAEINRQLQIIDEATSAKILGNSARVNRKRTHRLMKLYGVHSRLRRRRHPDNYYKGIGVDHAPCPAYKKSPSGESGGLFLRLWGECYFAMTRAISRTLFE